MNNLTDLTERGKLGYTKDGKVYLKSSLGQPDRELGIVKTTEEEALQYFIRRYDLIQNKVDAMLQSLEEAENKGSYLMQVLHLKNSLYSFNAIGPFEELLEKLESAEGKINDLIAVNRVKNLDVKRKLLEDAKVQIQNEDIREALKLMKEIRFNWMTVGSVDPEFAPDLESEFQVIMDQFNIVRDKYNEERRIEIEIKYQKLQIILETAKGLNTYPPEVEQSYHKFRKLEDEWRAVGNIPKDLYGPLVFEFKRIKKTIAKYARKGGPGGQRGAKPIYIPRFIPPHEQPLYDNLKYRMALIEEGNGLLKMDLRQANEYAKDLQARWKTAGQIPDKYKSEIFAQFNNISDRIFEASYLARVVHTKYPHFRIMPPQEQLEAKIDTMDEIILKEDMAVKITQAEFQFMSDEERQTEENRAKFSRLNTSVRKLKMKSKLLYEMKKELERMKGGGSSYGNYPPRERSSYGQPRTGGSSYSSDRPSYDRPDYNRERPAYDRPDYHRDRPSYDRPDYNRDRPSYDRPDYNRNRPSYDRPSYPSGDRPPGGDRFNSGSRYGSGDRYSSGERFSPNERYNQDVRKKPDEPGNP
jgi:hypothetical protein